VKNIPPVIVELASDELGGASGAKLFTVLAVGKANTPRYPYCVANEKIATDIGRVLGLRIPEALLYRLRGEWHVFSCFVERTESGEGVPEGTAAELNRYFLERPNELHGMICFDLLVGNNDRKTDNLIFSQADTAVTLIDHANALFYRKTETASPGIARLESIEDNLSAMFDKKHWFLAGLTSWDLVDNWCARISELPSYYVESVVENLPSELLTDAERRAVIDFIEKRKKVLGEIISENLPLFPGLMKPD